MKWSMQSNSPTFVPLAVQEWNEWNVWRVCVFDWWSDKTNESQNASLFSKYHIVFTTNAIVFTTCVLWFQHFLSEWQPSSLGSFDLVLTSPKEILEMIKDEIEEKTNTTASDAGRKRILMLINPTIKIPYCKLSSIWNWFLPFTFILVLIKDFFCQG